MQIVEFRLEFYEDVVDMYYSFMVELFGDKRKINPKYFYYKAVQDWILNKQHIVLVVSKGDVVGFSKCFIDDMNGLTEPIYNADICYVKEKYRNTRAGYLLYHNGYNMAKELNLTLVANARVENGVDKMIEKHFDLERMFINYEGKK